jgi:GDP-L-fucose synthase
MKIYVSGATGLVGSNVVKVLKEAGHEVYGTIFKADLLNYKNLDSLKDVLMSGPVELVIHCAGKVGGIKANSEDNQGFHDQNYEMGVNLINTAKRAGVPYFINLASSCAYPININQPKRECDFFYSKAIYEPTNEGYAKAKVAVADYLLRTYNQKGITLIPCNLYGVGDRYFEGSHIIPDLIQKFHKAKEIGAKEMTLFGTGQQYREFMNAKDLADIIRQLIHFISKEKNGYFPAYLLNVRGDKEISTMELATKVAATVGWSGTVKWSGQLGGIKRKPMDITLLKKLNLDFRKTDLMEGLAEQYRDYLFRFKNEIPKLFKEGFKNV